MNKQRKIVIILVTVIQILAIALLAGCDLNTPVSACHATGDMDVPYEEILIDIDSAKEHLDHPNDIFPVPVGGCPTSPLVIEDGKITICHATASEKNPYNEISVSVNGLNGHDAHDDDIIPAPDGGCPTSPLVIEDGKINICHATASETNPYNEISVSVNGLNGHVTHDDDIIPAPEGGCPTSPLVIEDGKITICHATASETNPYDEISVRVNGLNGHVTHGDDIIPAPDGGCPTSPLVIDNGKIMICHATGSETNPYNEISVSVNGLNGHNKHSDDIIPAPIGGCPAIKQ
jgi:hypothetical protein